MTTFDLDALSLAAHRPELGRRTFAVTSLSTGFALAVSAGRGRHDHDRYRGPGSRRGQDPGRGRRDPGLSRHAGQGRAVPRRPGRPGDLRRPRAHQGHLPTASPSSASFAVAPELYARQGDVSKIDGYPGDLLEGRRQGARRPGHGRPRRNRRLGQGTGKGDTAKLGVTGFCWGGRIVWLYAAHNPALKAGVAWYGRLEGETTALQPSNPSDLVKRSRRRFSASMAGQDQGIPVASVERMKAALATAGNQSSSSSTRTRRMASTPTIAPLPRGSGQGRLAAMPCLVERARRRLNPAQRPWILCPGAGTRACALRLDPRSATGPCPRRRSLVWHPGRARPEAGSRRSRTCTGLTQIATYSARNGRGGYQAPDVPLCSAR